MSAIFAKLDLPDFGRPRTTQHDSMPGETLVNMAGVLEVARRAATPQSLAFLDAFAIAYERVAGLPMTDGAKQHAAFAEAMKVIGKPHIQLVTLEGR